MIVDMALTWRVSIAEGVMVAADDKQLKAHAELEDIPNLQVLKLMESLTSRGYVRRTYTWKHHYWFLTPEGITYLREYLNLPDIIVPNTLKKQAARPSSRPLGGDDRPRFGGPSREGGFGRGRGVDREGYRSGPKEPSSYGDRPSFGRGREGGDRPRFAAGDRPAFGRGRSDAPAQ
jgi:small subunit ribosomal protein S10e